MANLRIHTSIASAVAVLAVGEVSISKRWNETSKQKSQERAVNLSFECVKAPEVPESFRALVEAVLSSQAVEVLKEFCDSNPNSFEIPQDLFDRPNLCESFINRGENWLTKQELELSFTNSATWKRISSRPEFQSNQVYKNAANAFRETILKLTGKAVNLNADKCDAILSKIEDSDLETSFGQFVSKRLISLRAKSSADSVDFGSL